MGNCMQFTHTFRYSTLILFLLSNQLGPDRLSVDRCGYDTAAAGGLDSSIDQAFGGMFSDTRWFVDIVGGGRTGVRTIFTRRWLGGKCWHVDVVVVFGILSAFFPLLLPGAIWPQSRSERRLHTTIFTSSKGDSSLPRHRKHDLNLIFLYWYLTGSTNAVHSWAVERTGERTERVELHYRSRLSVADYQSCRGQQSQSEANETSLLSFI